MPVGWHGLLVLFLEYGITLAKLVILREQCRTGGLTGYTTGRVTGGKTYPDGYFAAIFHSSETI